MRNSVEDPEKLAKKLDEDDKNTIKDALKDAEDWKNNNESAEKDAFEDKLKEIE